MPAPPPTNPSLFEPDVPLPEPVCYARVAVERAIDADGLTYASEHELTPGELVSVPLGRGDKAVRGLVIEVGGPELLDGFDPAKAKRVADRLGVTLPGPLLDLARWISSYYICPLGITTSTMLPVGVRKGVGLRQVKLLAREPEPEEESKLPPKTKSAWEAIRALPDEAFPTTPRDLADRLELSSLAAINRLERLGLLTASERDDVRTRSELELPMSLTPDGGAPPVLLPEQQRAVEAIDATSAGYQTHLLHGVTGSGKTEVYLRLIDLALDRGQSALVLVPEIALTPQIAERFIKRLGARTPVGVLHSGLSASARHRTWRLAGEGKIRVILGARSAVFAPMHDLGLVIVDEEHDDAGYKQDTQPRYHGRDVAIKRAQLEGCPVVLGSATPSMESFANARSGKSQLHTLPRRATGAAMPRVQIVDLARVPRAKSGGFGLLSPELVGALGETLRAGRQAILLLNRRGFASCVSCSRCEYVHRCTECDVAMVVHRPPSSGSIPHYLRCHHCLSQQTIPSVCPLCRSRLTTLGAGTQRAEIEVAHACAPFVNADERESFLLRVDTDTMGSVRDYFSALERFASGKARVLLGTQMIAKGLDFPSVALVGVLSADTAMWMPDFRAAERTFQLVSQVAGRAGRADVPGRVIVQTLNPDHPAVSAAATHDYDAFARHELGFRSDAGLPPTRAMARIVVRDAEHAHAHGRAETITKFLKRTGPSELELMGPMPCPLSRIAGKYRVGIELLAPTRQVIQRVLAGARAQRLLASDSTVAVDVDPTSLM